MTTFSTKVYDENFSLITTLAKAFRRGWTDQYEDVGSGTVSFHATDADFAAHPNIVDYGNIIVHGMDGTDRFGFIVDERSCPPAPQGENAERIWTLSGRGVKGLLYEEEVAPEAPLPSQIRQRVFDFASIAYDDSSWIAATQIYRQDSTSIHWGGLPHGWTDPLAYWIWSRPLAGVSPNDGHPAGTSYFRKAFTIGADKLVRVNATVDNTFRLFLDGAEVLDVTERGANHVEFYQYTTRLGAGTHELAVVGTNYTYTPSGLDSPAGVLVSVEEIDEQTGAILGVVVRSDSSWLALDYPASVPGMTPGKIVWLVITEAQARGSLLNITRTFTDTLDSNGAAWDPIVVSFEIGTSILDMLRTLEDQYVDGWMSPNLALNLVKEGTRTVDRTGSVEFIRGDHPNARDPGARLLEFLNAKGVRHLTNALLMRDATGSLTWREDTASQASNRRIASSGEVATAPSPAQTQQAATSIFESYGTPAVELAGRVVAASNPYVDYGPSDLVLMPNLFLTPTSTRLLSLSVTEDDKTKRALVDFIGAQEDV